jgi:uncharacterized membrane protein YidH (DUF202 family)
MMAEHESRQGGLARERTVLGWNRSGLAAVVCAAALLRHLWPLRGDRREVSIGLIAAAAIVWAAALLVFTTSTASRAKDALIGPIVFFLITVGTVILAVVAFFRAFFVSP